MQVSTAAILDSSPGGPEAPRPENPCLNRISVLIVTVLFIATI